MKTKLTAIVIGFSALTLAACGTPTPQQTAQQPVAEEQPTDASSDPSEGTLDDYEYDEPVDVFGYRSIVDGVPVFAYGDKADYYSDRSITVSYVEETTLSEYGAGDCGAGDAVSVYKVTAENNSGRSMSPYEDLIVVASYEDESGETLDASDVFDDYGNESLDAGQSMPEHLMNGKSGSSYWGFCHAGGSAKSVAVYATYMDEYGDTEGDAIWVDAESNDLK